MSLGSELKRDIRTCRGRLQKGLWAAVAFILMGICFSSNAYAQADCAQTSITGVPQAECEALVAFYNSTNGPGWTDNTNWNTTSSVQSWFGVSVPSPGYVSALVLTSNNLAGSIPPEIENLSQLQILRLYNNQLTGAIPTELGNLSQLTRIELGQNQLTGVIPTELGNLSQLTVLFLNRNQLTGTIPTELGNLSQLMRLNLSNNQLTGAIPPELGNLSQFRYLGLAGNQLTGTIPPELGNLSQLTMIELYSNQLTGPIPAELGNLSQLTLIELGNNQLTGPIPAELGNLSQLTQLWLYSNQLTGPIPAELGNLSQLTYLKLGNNQLTGPIPTELGNLSQLDKLGLALNQLTGSIPMELGNLSQLTSIELGSNQLTGPIPSEIGNLTSLTSFSVMNNRLEGDIPPALTNLTNLNPSFGYNKLTASDPTLLTFLSTKDPDWADTQTIPPENLGTTDPLSTSIRLTWTPIPYTGDGGYYRVLFSTAPGGPFTEAGITINKTASDFNVTGLTPSTTYYFTVETFTPAHGSQQNALTSARSVVVDATTATNSSPATTGVPDIAVNEDAASSTIDLLLHFDDAEDGAAGLVYTLPDVSDPALFASTAISGSSLTLDYAPDAFGTSTVTVRATDTGGLIVETTFTVTVNPVNDPPSFAPGGDVTAAEDQGPYSAPWATNISTGAANESDPLTFEITNDNPALFSDPPAIDPSAGTLTFTPAPDAWGAANISVYLSDGADDSGSQTFSVTVTAVNDPPAAMGVPNITVDEDAASSVIDLSSYFDDIEDGAAGLGYALAANSNPALFTSAAISGAVLTLDYAADANGTSSLTIQVSDAGGLSAETTFTATVNPVNDPPSFTPGGSVTMDKNQGPYSGPWATDISTGAANESDPLTFEITNDNPSLFSDPPAIDPSTGTLTFTTAPDAWGTANISVYLWDGADASETRTFTVTVNETNDPPTTIGVPNITVDEDSPATTIDLSSYFDDAQDGAGGLVYTLTDNSNPALFTSAAISGTVLTLAYAPDAGGASTLAIMAADADGLTVETSFTATVKPVNDPPSFTPGADVTVPENSGPYSGPWATDISTGAANESDPLTFEITNDIPALFSDPPAVDPSTGTLTFTPAPDAWGTANLSVYLWDGADASATGTFTVTVTRLNDPPTTSGIPNIAVREAGAVTTIDLKFYFDDEQDGPGGLGYSLAVNSNPVIFTSAAISGSVLTLAYAPDAVGASTLTILATDTGGLSVETTFTVTVNPVNDPPSFTPGTDVTVEEDHGPYAAPWASNISTGAANEPDPLTFDTANDNTGLFTEQPTIDPSSGILSFTPAPDAFGTANLSVFLWYGTVATEPRSFTITVTPVNDPPAITGQNPLTATAGRPLTLTLENLTVTDPDNAYPDDFRLIAGEGDGYTLEGTTITPGADAPETLSVPVKVNDGQADSAEYMLRIDVGHANQPPVADAGVDLTVRGGDLVFLDGAGSRDPDGEIAQFQWTQISGPTVILAGSDTPTPTFTAPGSETLLVFRLTVTDDSGAEAADEVTVAVRPNQPLEPPQPAGPPDGAIFETNTVTLTVTPLPSDQIPDGLTIHWRIRRADRGYGCPTDPPAFDHIGGDLTGYTVTGVHSGNEYVWQAGFVDPETGETLWSEERSFTAGQHTGTHIASVPPGITVEEYRMIAFPVDPGAPAELVLDEIIGQYDISLYRLGAYDPRVGGYIEYGEGLVMEPGRALWVLARNGVDLALDGVPASPDHDQEVELFYNASQDIGWNMIAAPSGGSFPWKSVELLVYRQAGLCDTEAGPITIDALPADNPWLDKRLWRWENGESRPDTDVLEDGVGYWVRAKAEGVVLRFPENARNDILRARTTDTAPGRGTALRTGLDDDGITPPGPPGALAHKADVSGGGGGSGCFIGTTHR